jgi:phosphatidylglycerophosphate synthase
VSEYQPTSRRPIAEVFRGTAHGAVRLCLAAGIHPDVVSYASIVASAGAAVCYWLGARHIWLLVVAPLLCYLRLWLNMLDGMVALAAGKASARGEILNDLPDRVSDVLVFAGVAHSGLCAQALGYWSAIFALLTAYVGTFGQAVGARRQFGGIMSKPWRMVALHAGAWLTAGLLWWGGGRTHWGPLSIMDWTCLLIIAGCIQTIAVRLRRIFVALDARPAGVARADEHQRVGRV